MENGRAVIILLVLSLFLWIPSLIDSYEAPSTHPGLTSEIIKFYEGNTGQKFEEDEKKIIIQASIDEDNDIRFFNHFYDPINNIGAFLLKRFPTSKVWVNDVYKQAKFLDADDKALFAVTKRFSHEGDFTWDRAIYEYAWGNKNRGLESLGHVLHLMEDLTVPDHVRNDNHPNVHAPIYGEDVLGEASFYEMYTNRFNKENIDVASQLIADNEDITSRSDIETYFDSIASFTNSNFFSRETLPDSGEYEMPVVKDLTTETVGSFSYLTQTVNNKKYKLVSFKDFTQSNNTEVRYYFLNDAMGLVMSSYWAVLSREAVKNGAGVIDLFFREVEKEKITKELFNRNRAPIAEAADAVVDAGVKTYSYIERKTIQAYNYTEKKVVQAYNYVEDKTVKTYNYSAEKISEGYNFAKNTTVSLAKETFSVFTAVMGYTKTSVADLFFDSEASISKVFVDDNQKQDNATPDAENNQELREILNQIRYTQSLVRELQNNISNYEKVVNNTTTVPNQNNTQPAIAENNNQNVPQLALALPVLSAGSPAPVVEEIIEETVDEDIEGEIGGDDVVVIPKAVISAANFSQCGASVSPDVCMLFSQNVDVNIETDIEDFLYIEYAVGDTVATSTEKTFQITEAELLEGKNTANVRLKYIDDTYSDTTTLSFYIYSRPVVINEIAWMGTEASTNDEWMEIANTTDYEINLDGFVLGSIDETPNITLSGTISANGYYLLERIDDMVVQDILADKTYAGALSNDGEEIILKYGDKIIDRTPAITDGFAFGDNDSKCSMERYSRFEDGDNADNWMDAEYTFSIGLDAEGNSICGTPKARNAISYVVNRGFPILSETTLDARNSPYIIDGYIFINGGKLNIPAGTILKFYSNNSTMVNIDGKIDMQGTSEKPVVLTSFYDKGYLNEYGNVIDSLDNSGGYIYMDGENGEIKARHTKIRTMRNGFDIFSGKIDMDDVEIEQSLDYSDMTFRNNSRGVFGDITYIPIQNGAGNLLSTYDTSEISISNLNFSGSVGGYDVINTFDTTKVSVGNINGTEINVPLASVYFDSELAINDVALTNTSDEDLFSVYTNAKLTVSKLALENIIDNRILSAYFNSNVDLSDVSFGQSGDLEVFATYGESKTNITNLTGTKIGDGGFAVMYGTSNLTAYNLQINEGSFNGITIYGNTGSVPKLILKNSKFTNIADTIISSIEANVQIENTELSGALVGIDIRGGELFVNNSVIKNNIVGIWNRDDSATIDVRDNDWGDNTGPYHETENPEGLGDTIVGTAIFDPWIGKEVTP